MRGVGEERRRRGAGRVLFVLGPLSIRGSMVFTLGSAQRTSGRRVALKTWNLNHPVHCIT